MSTSKVNDLMALMERDMEEQANNPEYQAWLRPFVIRKPAALGLAAIPQALNHQSVSTLALSSPAAPPKKSPPASRPYHLSWVAVMRPRSRHRTSP